MREKVVRLFRAGSIAATLAALSALAAACGPSSSSASTPPPPSRGPVDVLYAGSLVNFMEHDLGPAFSAATGYEFSGFSGGSSELASQIKGQIRQGDVFISASPDVNKALVGAGNGEWVFWYATYATSALVLGYDPHSRFASQLRTKPWYRVVTEPGFELGRTDPVQDPKGKLSVQALDEAATAYHDPSLARIATGSTWVFPEETLVGRLQAGQLDAGFFYTSEAKQAGIPTVSLGAIRLSAVYTVTTLDHAPHPSGAESFVAYLLGPKGRAALRNAGFSLVTPPRLYGNPRAVPAALRSVIPTP